MTANPTVIRREVTRQGLTAIAGASLSALFGSSPTIASALDGKGISNADVLSGFRALGEASIRFQDGRSFSLAQFRGRALIVNFWANWCVNCLAEFHSMVQLQQAAGGPNQLAVVLVSQPRDWTKDQAMARQASIPFPLAVINEPPTPAGASSTATILFGNADGLMARFGLPVCYMTSRSGQVVFTSVGGTDWVGQNVMAKTAQALHT